MNVLGDHAGGLWVLGERDSRSPERWGWSLLTSSWKGQCFRTANISEDPDGSLWVLQAGFNSACAPLPCYRSEVKCFGKVRWNTDSLRLRSLFLADGNGGFWLGGRQGGLVHWHAGVSEFTRSKR